MNVVVSSNWDTLTIRKAVGAASATWLKDLRPDCSNRQLVFRYVAFSARGRVSLNVAPVVRKFRPIMLMAGYAFGWWGSPSQTHAHSPSSERTANALGLLNGET